MNNKCPITCETCSSKLRFDEIYLIRAGFSLISNCQDCYNYNEQLVNLDRTMELIRPRMCADENGFEVELVGKVSYSTYLLKTFLRI